MESAVELAMETSRVDSVVPNQARKELKKDQSAAVMKKESAAKQLTDYQSWMSTAELISNGESDSSLQKKRTQVLKAGQILIQIPHPAVPHPVIVNRRKFTVSWLIKLQMTSTFELPVEGLTDLLEIPKDLVFDAKSIVSFSGELVSISGKKKEMKIEFGLLCDIMAKTISVKAGSFDAITQEKFLMIAGITCGVKAKGYAIQISLLLENVPNLELGESSEFPSSKVLTEKTVHRYIVLNDKVGMEVVTAEPRVKKTPVTKAASKKIPATDAASKPVVKKKRTTKIKTGSAKETLETLPVESVPLQMIGPIPVVPTEQPPVPKRKIQKRKRGFILGSDDEIVGSEPVVGSSIVGEAAVEAVDDMAEKDVETVVERVGISKEETVVLNEGISTTDEVDIIIEQVIAETAKIDTDVGDQDVVTSKVGDKTAGTADEFEVWFNLSSEDIQARLDADRPLETASDTDEEFIADQVSGTGVETMETEDVDQSADEAMSLEDILMTIPVDCPLPSALVEITKIILGKTILIPGVNEGDWYKASLPKISAADKGKAPLLERDPVKGNPIKEKLSLIVADIDLLVQLREKIIDEVDRFFNSFSLKRLASSKIDESYFDKEALILSWAETDSTRVALNRRTYILTKYRELLIRKFLEVRKINFTPGEGSSATDLKVMEMLSDLHLFVVEELKEQTMAHGLKWEKTCCSKIFEGRPRDRGAIIVRTNTNTKYSCWIRTMIRVDGVWLIEPCADHWVKIQKRVVNSEISRQRSYEDTLPPVSAFLKLMRKRWADVCLEIVQNSVSVATNAQLFLDQRPHSSSTSTDSSLHFDDNEIRVEDEVASPHIPLPAVASNITETLAQIRASVDEIRFEQIRRKDDGDRLRDMLLMHIRDIEKKSTECFDELDRVNRASRIDSQDIRTVLSLDIRSSQKQPSAQIAAASIDNVDVRREIHTKIDDLDRQVATIRSEQLDFRAKAEENYLNLSTQLGNIVDFLRGGDAKKGEGSSSRPQPPPDDHSQPSGGTGGSGSGSGAQGQSRSGLGSGISQSRGTKEQWW
ncbi:hypothetical protein F511_28301 [Dorcoceras hygrometricum]|uniref:Splicing factor 3B subunit 1-like n=1 Tax=Dorcoceras hygrometricum TaxID=472368 RepID=A0A2Z7BYA1_9LAMI|nr:hypothetical protein F511_28301 [Dorcoceras hygrometricum]